MKQISIVLIIICVFTLVACNKTTNSTASNTIEDGVYVGFFQRQINGSGNITNVSITFTNNSWVGQSQLPTYPALCGGSYDSIANNKISFSNMCVWTADFDWTLMLKDTFSIQTIGNQLIMVKDWGNNQKDIYNLTKQ